jgi:uncharacterized membrane protein
MLAMNDTSVFNDSDADPEIQLKINKISSNEPWKWLVLGWRDMRAAPTYSLLYGLVFVVLSYLIIWGVIDDDMFFLVPLLIAGFFLYAPILGIGLYSISRSLERDEKVEFCQILKAVRSNPAHIAVMGVVLLLIMLFWMFSAIIISIFFLDNTTLEWDRYFQELFISGENNLFVFMGVLFGAGIAFFTFSISVITVPLLMDRQVDFMTAINTSVACVRENFKPLMLWAYLIVMLVCMSFLTFFIGLLVAMPVIGHGTWHGYRALVESPE